jgi:hypothetical protein
VISRTAEAPAHPELVDAAARGYLHQLRLLQKELRAEGRLGRVVENLILSHDAALEKRRELAAADVPFERGQLVDLSDWQLLAILDQHALGWGRDNVPLIVMGTEEAYNPATAGDIALACCSSVLWLSGSKIDVLVKIDPKVAGAARSPRARPYHLQPNDFYGVETWPGRSTWECLATLLRPDNPLSLLAPPTGPASLGLGDLCYQTDVSAYPSKLASGGRQPVPERVKFLSGLVSAFDGARVLLFHGGPWDSAREAIASSFLGRPAKLTPHDAPREWFAWDQSGDRSIIHTYALSGRVRNRYLELVRSRLIELAPGVVFG